MPLGKENQAGYLESQQPVSIQNPTPYLDLFDSLDLDAKESLISELQEQERMEQMMEDQEKALEIEKRYEGLTDSQKSIVNEYAGNNDLDSVNKYTDLLSEINKLETLNSVKTKERKYDKDWEDAPWYRLDKAAKSLAYSISDAFHKDTYGMGEKADKYKELIAERRVLETPIAENTLKSVNEQLELAKNEMEGYGEMVQFYPAIAGGRAKEPVFIPLSELDESEIKDNPIFGNKNYVPSSEKQKEWIAKRNANKSRLNILSKQKDALEKFINGDDDLLSGLGTQKDGIATMGMLPLIDKLTLYNVANKQRDGKPLTTEEESLLKAYNTEQKTEGLDLGKNRFWYRTGQGTGHSIVFLEQTVATLPIGGAGGAVTKAVVTPLAERLALKTILGQVGRNLTKKELLKLSAINYVEKGLIGTGNLLTQGAVMPNTYDGMARKFIGQSQLVTDGNGDEKVLVSASARKAYEKDAKNRLTILGQREDEISKKSNRNSTDEQQLLDIQNQKAEIEHQLKSIYDPNKKGNNIIEDVSNVDAFIYGYTETLKELAAEKYVGELGSKLTKGIGGKLSGTFVDKATRPITSTYNKGREILNNTAFGKLSGKAMYHTGTPKLFHNLPGEVLEEIAVQLTPSYMEDYSKQLKELANPTFYLDVIAQTLLLGSAFTGVGTSSHLGNYATSKDYRAKDRSRRKLKEQIRDTYKSIDKAVSDEKLAEQIVMNTGGTLFEVQDYQAKVAELRKDGRIKEANNLEKKSFLNLGIKALQTDTIDEFEKSLNRVQSNSNLSEETRKNAALSIPKIEDLRKIRNKHAGKFNSNKLIELEVNNLMYKESLSDIDNKIKDIEQQSLNEIEQYKRVNGVDNETHSLFDMIGKLNADENGEYNKFLMDLRKENIGDVNQLMDLSFIKDYYDQINYENNKELRYQMNPVNQEVIKKEYREQINKAIVESVGPENVEEVKQDLEKNGELTPEVNSKINQKVEERVAKSTSEDKKVNVPEPKQEVPVETKVAADTKAVPQNVTQAKGFTQIKEDDLFSEANENESLSLQPVGLDESNPKHNKVVNQYSKVISSINKDLKEEMGRDVLPNEMFGMFMREVNPNTAEKHFNFFKKAFEKSGLENNNFDWNGLYSRYFENLKSFASDNASIDVAPTVGEINQQDAQANSIIQEDATPVGYNQDNNTIKYLGRKTAVAVNKVPFLGVKYRAAHNQIDDTVTYVNDEKGELNTEGMSNLNVILNPDILVPGKRFTLEIPQDWEGRIVSEWKYNSLKVLVQNTTTMREWMDNNNIQEGSKEWISKVPMDMIIDGINVGPGVHDVQWWNTRNIADFKDATINGELLSPEQAQAHQRQVVLEGQQLTNNIRQNVFNGNNQMVVSEREEGHTLTNTDGKLTSLFEANPNVNLGIFSPQGFITNKGDNGNEYFNGKVVNEEVVTDKGHIFMLSRIGTERVNNTLTPTYVAHKVHTNHNQEALQELVKSRQRLYDAIDILNKIGNHPNPTEEQTQWATTVRDQVKYMTGISINNIAEANGSIVRLGMDKLKQLYPLNTKDKQGLMLLPQLANIENQKLPIIHEDGSVTNYSSKAGKGYKAMLMDNLHTQKKFHTIQNTDGTELKVLDIQPRIKFELEKKNEDVVVKEKKKEVKIAKEKIQIKKVEEVQEPITDITEGQRRRVVEYLFHNILGNIDVTKDFTNKDVIDKIQSSFDDYLGNIKTNEIYSKEYQYLIDNKDSILGLNEFSNDINTVKSELSAFLNQEFEQEKEDQQLNDEGLFEKNNNKSSFENDVKTSLSTKLKMFFAGIKKGDSKVVTEDFADIDSYYGLDEVIGGLQDMLVNIPNSPKAFKDKINNQIKKNPDEFGFLQNVLDKFDNATLETQKEILFRLNQTKNEMHFVMYSKSRNGNYTLMVYDANSKNPRVKAKLQYQENLKQSELVDNFGDTYKLKKDVAKRLVAQYNSWKGKYDATPNIDYVNWLGNFGITVSEKTIQDYKDGLVEGHNKFSGNFLNNGGVFGTLFSNLNTAIERQNKDEEIVFKYKSESKNSKDSFNILLNNNNGFLKTLIDVQVNNTFNLASSMYIGGKTINAFSQPNYTTEQLRKLKDTDNPLVDNLKQSAFSQNSLLLKLLDNKKIKNSLNIGYVSLQSLKQQGQKVYQSSEIVDLSSQDYDLLLQGFFESENSYFKNQELENKGIQLRGAKMTFPTLSDSSQMFIFNTVALDLKKGNFNFESDVKLNDEVLDLMYDQLVKPDLDRIEAFLKSNKNTNIQGLDLGSQLFTMIPSLNTLEIDINDSKIKLLTKVHADVNNGNSLEETIEGYKSIIKDKIQEVITENVNSKLAINDGVLSGSWVENGFINQNKEVSFLDSKYLNSRGTTDKIEQLQIAAYDYAVNYYLNQAQIQMLFAGDIANYVKDKDGNKFSADANGNADVTKPLVSVAEGENQFKKEQEVYTNIIKGTSVNMSKRLKELISPGNRIAESNGEKYIQVMVDDVETSSNTLAQLAEMWYPALYKENKDDIQRLKDLENEIKERTKNNQSVKVTENEYKSLKKSLQNKFTDITEYFTITATDAQEYTTWGEHLHILLNQGRIQKELHDELHKKLTSQSKDGLNDQNQLSNEEKKVVFQPIKPLHAGLYFEDMKDDNGNVISKAQRYVYVKTSSFPLLPQLTKGMELDNLRVNIEKLENKTGKKVRISYQSGNKVGAVKNAVSINKLYTDYNSDLEQAIINSSATLDRENFSIQQDKPFKTDKNIKANKRDEINRGTQFEKILLGNGINQVSEKIFPNNFDNELLESLGIEEKDGMLSGKDLYNIYTSLYTKEQDILRNQLYSSLGLNLNGEWTNNIDTLENIKNVLNKRLSNQQDKEILELSYIVPEEKNGRLVNNYYTKEEVKAKGLKPSQAEFNIPIWMSPNSRKFESVLNSVVNNKLVNLKLPGFSSPVASQEGFTYKDESAIKNTKGIIFTEKYDGTLKATHNSDGSLKFAQIMVASKFRVKKRDEATGKYKDELINLKEYTKVLEDGRTVLDMDRINPDLLSMFSFRIPTSAHQSGALIEVVGFLPHTSGDLMIVPKDHVTQIGEDYDIDTRFVYSQNYRVDSKGNVRKIDSKYIQSRIDALDNSLKNDQEADAQIDEILNLFDAIKESEEIQNMFAQERTTREQKVQILRDKLNHLLIENQIVDVYKSIFGSKSPKIQKMIGATLSTQFAEDSAKMIDDKLNSQKDDSNFSIFDDRYQKSILKLGASGKLGIGVHSNWVVLNSLFQQMESNPKLINGYNQETGQAIPFTMTVGNFVSNGTLGSIEALRPTNNIKNFTPRLLSVVNMESQNSSTDNQKLQIMGRRNENKYTINVFALMSNLGFDKDMVNDKEVSLPSLFISQPIIRRYVELKEQYDSIMSDFQDNVDEVISGQLAKEFGEGVELIQTKAGLKMDFDQMKYVERNELTAQRLYDSLIKGTNAQQWAVYEKFLEFQKHAKNINKVQQLANIDSDGLGISFFNTIAKKDALLLNMTSENLNIDGIENLFGDQRIVANGDIDAQEELTSRGYIKVEEQDTYTAFVKPTTPLNAKLISSIASGYNLWSNVLPFENEFIDEQIVNILEITEKNPDTKNGLELKYKVVSEMKDFIYSYSNIGIFDNPDISKEREGLFMDTDNNQSLASYLNLLKKENNRLFNEPFFKDLEFVLNKNTQASLIKYSTNDRTNFNKNSVYTTFNILNDSTEKLPDYNGKPYTYDKLAKDLTKYSLLSNQENGAIGFRNYIPMAILDKYNVSNNLRRFSGVGKNSSHNLLLNGDFKGLMNIIGAFEINEDKTIDIKHNISESRINEYVDRINTKYGTSTIVYDNTNNRIVLNNIEPSNFKSLFTKQFFQHNPAEAKKYNWRNKKQWLKDSNTEKLDTLTWFTGKNEGPEYISIRDSKNSKFILFELDTNGVYRRINTLGGFGINEYSPFKSDFNSLLEDNNFAKNNLVSTTPIKNNIQSETIEDKIGINQGVETVLDNIIKTNGKFSDVATMIKPFVNEVGIETIDFKGIANAAYVVKKEGTNTVKTSLGELERGKIYLSKDLLETGKIEKIEYALMEEVVHSITVDEIDKYVDTRDSYLDEKGNINITYKVDNPPAHIIKLVALFKEGSKHILNKYSKNSTLEEAITKINEQKAIWNKDTSSEFYKEESTADSSLKVDTYRTLNLGEFVAGVMLSETFRNEMNSVTYRQTGKSILSNFAEAIKRLLKSIAPKATENSITEHTFDAVLTLLNYNSIEAKPAVNSKIQETKADKDAKDLLDNLEDPDTAQQGGETIDLQPIEIGDVLNMETC